MENKTTDLLLLLILISLWAMFFILFVRSKKYFPRIKRKPQPRVQAIQQPMQTAPDSYGGYGGGTFDYNSF